jgi:hypothetical protein
VARAPGPFVEITDNVHGAMNSPLLCDTGAVRLTISTLQGPNRPHRASYHRTADGFLIGTLDFERDTPVIDTQSTSNLGGAGFALCTTGVVLDADARNDTGELLAFRFLRLDGSGQFAKGFPQRTRQADVYSTTVSPRLFRSPDGSVFIALVASSLDNVKKAIVLDRQDGLSTDVELHGTGMTFAARLTTANTVAIDFQGRSFGPVPIPDP